MLHNYKPLQADTAPIKQRLEKENKMCALHRQKDSKKRGFPLPHPSLGDCANILLALVNRCGRSNVMWLLNLHSSLYGILNAALFECCHQVKKPMLVLEKQPLCDLLFLSRIVQPFPWTWNIPLYWSLVPTLAPDSSSLSGETFPRSGYIVHLLHCLNIRILWHQPCQYICPLPWLQRAGREVFT